MREKLGLYYYELEEDIKLIDNLFKVMEKCGSEFTNTFRLLAEFEIDFPFETYTQKDKELLA